MSTATWKNLFLGGIMCLVVAVPARGTEVAVAPQDEAVAVKVDCLAPFAHLRSLASEADILADTKPAQPMTSSTCKLHGTGPLSYCDGSCNYTHEICSHTVVGKTHTCVCK
jgi:hypothetical protein